MTSKAPAEIQTLIDIHISSFNTQNRERFLNAFGDTAIIIDGIAPYRWLNPNAPADWLDDVEKWRNRGTRVLRDGVLECGGQLCLRGHLRDSYDKAKGTVGQSDWYPRIHIRKTGGRLED